MSFQGDREAEEGSFGVRLCRLSLYGICPLYGIYPFMASIPLISGVFPEFEAVFPALSLPLVNGVPSLVLDLQILTSKIVLGKIGRASGWDF